MHREDEHARGRRRLADALDRLDAARPGHADVDEGDVGAERGGLPHGLVPVAGLPDDLQVPLAVDQHAQPRPEDGVIIRDENPNPSHQSLPKTGTRT